MESLANGLSLTIEISDDTLWYSKLTRRIFNGQEEFFNGQEEFFNGQEGFLMDKKNF